MLKTSNVDCSFFRRFQIAGSHAKVACWTHHSTSETKRIIGENCFGCTIIIFGGNAPNKTFHVQLRRTRLLTRSVSTFQASISFLQCSTLAQRCMLDVVKVIVEWWATLKFAIYNKNFHAEFFHVLKFQFQINFLS